MDVTIGLRHVEKIDQTSLAFVSSVLGEDLRAQALDQASLGLNFGGLGFRKAATLAAPAHLVSSIEARLSVFNLLCLAREAGDELPAAVPTYDRPAS